VSIGHRPAPIDEIEALRRRMDWRFPWVSSFGSDFHHDADVVFNPGRWRAPPAI